MIERSHTPYAVINVDVQRDFCPGGSLAVKDGDQVVKPLNEVNLVARRSGVQVIFTRDLHPSITTHFAKDGGVWPVHCVQETTGADFHPDLEIDSSHDVVVSKGMGEAEDAYSGFDARTEEGTMLDQILKAKGVKRLLVGGLATDYCVKATVLDGLKNGYDVFVMEDAVRAVDINPDDGKKAWEEMLVAGAKKISSSLAESELLAMDAYEAGSDMGRVWRETHSVNEGSAS